MNFTAQIEQLNKVHQLIQSEKTGTPSEFAQKIKSSRSQLYNIIDYLKSFDASIKYCKKRESFYYSKAFNLSLRFHLEVITERESIKISGGFLFPSIFLDGSLINLPFTNEVLEKPILFKPIY
jgi:hypothetical protein